MELFSIIRMASVASIWRGLDYWEAGCVRDLRPSGGDAYDAEVTGTAPEPYRVHVDITHVRQSSCTCPYAAGTRRICKHMVATVFAAHPEQVDVFRYEVEQEELAYEQEQQAHREELWRQVRSLTKDELRRRLYEALLELEERRSSWW